MYDGDLYALVERMAPYKRLRLTLEQAVDEADLASLGEIETMDGLKVTVRVPRDQTKDAAAKALTQLPVADVMIEEPPVEEIIRDLFRQHGAARQGLVRETPLPL